MQSFLLVGAQKTRSDYIENFYKQQEISLFDRITLETEGSIGVQEIRKLQENLFLSPRGEKKVILIESAENLTIEAQNALLKVLEEPPSFVFFFLSAATDTFLPTILSRCQIISLGTDDQTLSADAKQQLAEDIQIITTDSIAEKLLLAQKVSAEKANTKEWLTNVQLLLRELMLSHLGEKDAPYPLLLATLQEAYKTLTTTNVNAHMLLEHYFLSI